MPESKFKSAAILGSGSFGTALAKLLAPKMETILLIGRDCVTADSINLYHRNPHYLSNIQLQDNVRASIETNDALAYSLIIFAVPTSSTREVACKLFNANLSPTATLLFPENPIAILSGPNHAEEIAAGMATCAVIASDDHHLAVELQELFTFPHFRAYTSNDLAGIEFGGAVKNVYAIAAGMAHGLGLGDNAVAALVTRSLAEMTRLGTALGGRIETFSGLSGVGDLIVTCFSEHSRNHRVGLALGSGKSLEEAVAALGMVAEGVPNTLSIHETARSVGVRTPIIDAVYSILYQGKSAPLAMSELLSRDPRPEHS